jgi:hypothetical protein
LSIGAWLRLRINFRSWKETALEWSSLEWTTTGRRKKMSYIGTLPASGSVVDLGLYIAPKAAATAGELAGWMKVLEDWQKARVYWPVKEPGDMDEFFREHGARDELLADIERNKISYKKAWASLMPTGKPKVEATVLQFRRPN